MDLTLESWYADFANYGWWEIPAVIAALLYILLAARRNRWCFAYGLISSAIYIYLTIRLKLYFDSFINIYYVGMSVYGWIDWSKNDPSKELQIDRLGWRKFGIYAILIVIISLVLGYWAEHYTDDSLPYWDAFTTVASLLATYWVVKRYLENWLIWIIVDLLCTFIYFFKGLPLTAALFLLYTFMAVFGYYKWMQWERKDA
jgi:nicotinamide mononucleotide transporter